MEDLIALAHAATEAVKTSLKRANRDRFGDVVMMGADGTPTQLIDKIAEDAILESVDRQVNILSEEAGFIDNKQDYTFIIDPIDGTRNAIHGIPFYCTSIAIGTTTLNSVEYGIVTNLLTGDNYEAMKGKGAYLNDKRIYVDADVSDVIYVLVLGSSGNEKTWKHASMHTTRSLGAAALEMCMVASGSAHVYFMPNEALRVTDFAAGTLIVREAGGEVYSAEGVPLETAATLDVRSSVLAVSTDKLLEALL